MNAEVQLEEADSLTEQLIRGNASKRERYAYAHGRLKVARAMGFHIEATMICESMLSDRLHSHLHWRVHIAQILDPQTLSEKTRERLVFDQPVSYAFLARLLTKKFDDLGKEQYRKLPSRLLKWAPLRNKAAHGYVFTYPAHKTYEEDYAAYQAICQASSDMGAELVRLMNNWDRAYRSTHRRRTGQ